MTVNQADYDRAIQAMEEARQIHQEWWEFVTYSPEVAQQMAPQQETGGDAAHHRRWIEEYDNVLAILRGRAL